MSGFEDKEGPHRYGFGKISGKMEWRGRTVGGAAKEGVSGTTEDGGPPVVGTCEEWGLAWVSAGQLVLCGLGSPSSLPWASVPSSAVVVVVVCRGGHGGEVPEATASGCECHWHVSLPQDKAPSLHPHPYPNSPWHSWASCLQGSHVCKEQNPAPNTGAPHSGSAGS